MVSDFQSLIPWTFFITNKECSVSYRPGHTTVSTNTNKISNHTNSHLTKYRWIRTLVNLACAVYQLQFPLSLSHITDRKTVNTTILRSMRPLNSQYRNVSKADRYTNLPTHIHHKSSCYAGERLVKMQVQQSIQN